MAKIVLLRMASAAGLIALALFFVGVDPFLSTGAGFPARTPAVSVDRSLKGDRLDIAPDWQSAFGSQPGTQPRAQMPFACDPAFSPIFSSASANVYRRCMA
jgi:hypothetical protein